MAALGMLSPWLTPSKWRRKSASCRSEANRHHLAFHSSLANFNIDRFSIPSCLELETQKVIISQSQSDSLKAKLLILGWGVTNSDKTKSEHRVECRLIAFRTHWRAERLTRRRLSLPDVLKAVKSNRGRKLSYSYFLVKGN